MRYFLAFILTLAVIHPAPAGAKAAAPKPAATAPAATPDDDITVRDAYAYATTPVQKTGAVFMALVNTGAAADRLVKASAPEVANSAELHKNMMEDNTMTMIREDFVDLPAGQTVMFQPMGYHVMLIGLHAPLKAGDKFPLTLTFGKKGTVTAEVAIRSPADGPDTPEDMQKSILP